MGLRIESTEGKRRWLSLRETAAGRMRVEVFYRSKREIAAFWKRIQNLTPEEQAKECATFYVAGWDDLTPAVARSMGVNVTDDNANGDGAISHNSDNARDFWFYVPDNEFALPIINFASGILELEEAERVAAKNALGRSSAPETLP